MNKLKVSYYLLFLLFLSAPAFAQTAVELEDKYIDAKHYYEEGKIDSATYLLEDILKSPTFPKLYQGVKADIYRLLAMSYITLDRINDSEKPLREMLALRPFYKAADDDLMRFQAALDTLKASSLFSVGLQMGVNATFAERIGEPISVISAFDNPNLGDEKYNFGTGFYLGFYIKYRMLKNLSISIAPSLSSYTYGYREDYNLQRTGKSDAINTKFSYSYRQTVRYLEIPISVSYSLTTAYKFSPFISAGWFNGFLLDATKESNASFITAAQSFQNKENFVSANSGYLLGFGFTYRLDRLVLNLDARYKKGLVNLTNSNNRFVNSEVALGFYDIPNDIKISNLELGFSLLYHLNFKVF
ncbi:MAG: PorT family protein [Cytophagales bacterium]|nr:MAG: PorT family protein [Cytophagales bacterium]